MSGVEGGSIYERLKKGYIGQGVMEAVIILSSLIIIILLYNGVITDVSVLVMILLIPGAAFVISEALGYQNTRGL